MDKLFLDNIIGSQHVNESLADRIRARGSAFKQQGSALLGKTINPLENTKVQSLWKKFIANSSFVIKDFNKNVINQISKLNFLTDSQKMDIKKFENLNKLITTDSSKLAAVAVQEGFGDIFKRPYSLSKALISNDASKILEAYKNKIKSYYDEFLKDSQKVTGLPSEKIDQIISGIGENEKNILNSVKALDSAISIQNPIPQKQSPTNATPPPLVQPSVPTTPVSVSTPTAQNVSNNPDTTSNTSATVTPVPQTKSFNGYDDLVGIITRVIDIINDAVASDKTKSAPFVGKDKKKLPTNWHDPSLTKHLKEDASKEDKKKNPSQEDAEKNFEEIPGEFLYNFHGNFNKHRLDFTVSVIPSNKTLEVYNLKSKSESEKIQVFWHSKEHKNDIYARYWNVNSKPGENIKTTKIFSFFDHDVESRVEGSIENFSIEKLLTNANPGAMEMINKASPASIKLLNNKKDIFYRSLYATVSRKSMEFRSKRKEKEISNQSPENSTIKKVGEKSPFSWDPKGTVTVSNSKGEKFPIPSTSVKDFSIEDRKELNNLGYWKEFPNVQGKPDDNLSPKKDNNPPDQSGSSSLVSKEPNPTATSPVIAPVSNIDKTPSNTGDELSFDDNGNILWKKSDGNVQKISKNQYAKNWAIQKRLKHQLRKKGYFKKFPDLKESIDNCFNYKNYHNYF